MDLKYKQKYTYQILCDTNGNVGVCYIVTNTDIFNGTVYMVSTSDSQQISLDAMKKIVAQLKSA